MPTYLTWNGETAINDVERRNKPPERNRVEREHRALVEALQRAGVDVTVIKPKESLPEAAYIRDAMGVIGDMPLVARFKHPIRQGETGLIHGAKNPWREGDIIEFGDVLLARDAVLVGLGDRTNRAAVETLKKMIDREVIAIELLPGTLHLDYALSLAGKVMVVCPELFIDKGQIEMLKDRFGVKHTVLVSPRDYTQGLTNLLYTDPETVISTTSAWGVNEVLRRIGLNVIQIDFDNILRGEGAPRCCTAPIERED